MKRPRSSKLIQLAAPLELRIRARLDEHLAELGYERDPDGSLRIRVVTKEAVRGLHRQQRLEKLQRNSDFIRRVESNLLEHFADGAEVDPDMIAPRLELVEAGTWQSDLFRLASLLWTVPVSQGYGRRMRFLVWDQQNEKLIGAIGIGDPPFNLGARDRAIGWNASEREARLVDMMDAFLLGAVPPYSQLLGGKLVAALVRTTDVADHFWRRYARSVGVISGQTKRARLVAVTTTSALGRSSVYNRLRLDGVTYFNRAGWTGGWGHFHVSQELFDDMKRYLALHGHSYPKSYEFGDGPNWRLRTIRAALDLMNVSPDLLKHGVMRELFIAWLADDAISVLRGETRRVRYSTLRSASDVGKLARDRWLAPRAARDPSYQTWTRTRLREMWTDKTGVPDTASDTSGAVTSPMA